MEKFIWTDELAYRKAMYLIAIQNLATTKTNFAMLCRIISDIEPETEYKDIIEKAHKQAGDYAVAFTALFDKQAQEDQDLNNINLNELLDLLK